MTATDPATGSIRARVVVEFLALAFGISWANAALIYAAGVELGGIAWTALVAILFMWAPAVAAIVVTRRRGESVREHCGLRLGRPRWVTLAWLAPVALIGTAIALGSFLPGVSITTEYGAFLLDAGLPQEQVDAALSELASLPFPPAVLFVLQGLVAGLTLNALAALGEELGWRGLLLAELSTLGFWKLSAVTVAVWGIWHAPVAVQGYNFPEAPLLGVAVMTAATVAMSPVYTYLTVRAESVLAATFFHGTFNGLGALSVVYLAGTGNILIGPVGLAGVAAGLLATAVCVVHDRVSDSESITTGGRLSPWE